MKRGRVIKDRRVELVAGVGFFILGGLLLRDAYEGHARQQPIWLRPFAWW